MGKEKEMSKDKKKRKLQKYKQKNPTIIIDGEEFARQVNPFTGSISADSMAKDKKGKFIKMYQNPQECDLQAQPPHHYRKHYLKIHDRLGLLLMQQISHLVEWFLYLLRHR